jgi:SAM-dependent methyltransferase
VVEDPVRVSHPEMRAFFELVAQRNGDLIENARAIEIGSCDVNGTLRSAFARTKAYVGVDLEQGQGVDLVAFGHQVDESDGAFDVAVSGSCFEHDPHWRETFTNMVRLTRPGGLVAFTCASKGFPEHGTRRTLVTDSPGTQALGLDYYRNLEAVDFEGLPLGEWLSTWGFWYIPTTMELFFAGVRAGGDDGQLPEDADVEAIRDLMPFQHRAVRFPLRVARRIIRDEERYQRVILPYWLAMFRRFGERAAR